MVGSEIWDLGVEGFLGIVGWVDGVGNDRCMDGGEESEDGMGWGGFFFWWSGLGWDWEVGGDGLVRMN